MGRGVRESRAVRARVSSRQRRMDWTRAGERIGFASRASGAPRLIRWRNPGAASGLAARGSSPRHPHARRGMHGLTTRPGSLAG